VSVRPRRSVGVLVSGALLAVLAIYFWQRPADSARSNSGSHAVLRRGGQLVASIRGEPRSFNRYVAREQTTDLLTMLTQGRLVRINRSTFDLEPWLAERWESSPDGRTHTLFLRRGVTWSDGTPFTSGDVLFSFDAAFDPKTRSLLASGLTVGGQPIRAAAPDDHTVVLTFADASGPGLRLLDNLPIVPRHKLKAALDAGRFAAEWGTRTPPADIVGTGPFVLREYQPGQRVVLDRNPRYWRKAPDGAALPYLDRIVLEIVPDQNAELLRLQSGALDATPDALRPEDFVGVRRAEQGGALKLIELGVAPDPDAFWFCLKPAAKQKDPRFAFVQKREFRQAISHAVDREEFARTVYLGEAVPAWGPVTPGNRRWFTPNLPRYAPDLQKARDLLKGIGLEDRDGDGIVEDAKGTAAKFTVITQRGVGSARIGIALDIVPLDFGAMIARMQMSDYDAIYMRLLTTDLDPALNMDFWLSNGSAHVWNLEEPTPATEWEKRIDELMQEQASTIDEGRRKAVFADVQRIFAENVPMLYFAAPRMYAAHSSRLAGVVPSVMRPPILWNADMLAVTDAASGR